jgi:hypothetical protein
LKSFLDALIRKALDEKKFMIKNKGIVDVKSPPINDMT